MTIRNAVGDEHLNTVAVPKTDYMKRWARFLVLLLIVNIIGFTAIPSASATDEYQASDAESSNDRGIQVASWLLTIPYCAGKSAFAIAGSVVGGLGYAFSGGNTKTAQAIWTTTVYGTYILRPAHLRGEEPIHFLGSNDDNQNEAVKHASVLPQSEKR